VKVRQSQGGITWIGVKTCVGSGDSRESSPKFAGTERRTERVHSTACMKFLCVSTEKSVGELKSRSDVF